MTKTVNGYVCKSCGQYHEGLPLSYFTNYPAQWYDIPDDEKHARCVLGEEQCIIDETLFFMRGNVEIPIVESDDVFAWTVWVALSKELFARASDLWDDPRRKNEPPYACRVANSLPCYPDTFDLKGVLRTRGVGLRPSIELEDADHALVIEQRRGMTKERVQEIAEALLHSSA